MWRDVGADLAGAVEVTAFKAIPRLERIQLADVTLQKPLADAEELKWLLDEFGARGRRGGSLVI